MSSTASRSDKGNNCSFNEQSSHAVNVNPHQRSFKCKIDGIPRPQARCFATTTGKSKTVHMINTSKTHSTSFKRAFQSALSKANTEIFLKNKKPVLLTVRFCFPHPKNHCECNSQSKQHILKTNAPICVTKRPDLDNLLKLLLDSLQEVCHDDDCNVVHIDSAKLFDHTQKVCNDSQADTGSTIIKITEVDESETDATCSCLSCKKKRNA